ncbi:MULTISPECIES: phage holin family protein [Bacillaceae]|uniref:phage holin family protein n=1 Tax=Bacillaceae TaxID=186817 RepID=UPI001E43A60F|nr:MULTISPECIES: phage holin family protein [Bacillaceae]MCE4052171.1 phage holin family protein [Bacillus sp. Au-Bac7]MCM3029615.1 phage holin family protein [Niallia sp. MER 6]MDL0437057.1 phage holin family protein [Niallia sp. SS-2023]
MKWLLGIVINAVFFIALAGLFKDSFYLSGIGAAIGASIILSLLNIVVKPILILLTLPVTILSLGLFLFVINAITLSLTDRLMGDSFEISSFGMSLLASILLSLFNIIIQNTMLKSGEKKS